MTKYILSFLLIFYSGLSAAIYVNQAGYLPHLAKHVFVDQPADSFIIYIDGSQDVAWRGALSFVTADDPNTGLAIYSGDFSGLQTPGTYRIFVSGQGISDRFEISDSVYVDLYQKSLKSFYYQRCGVDLTGPPAAPYFRSRGHIADGTFHSSSGNSGFHDSRGGWYDAGDYGKYIVNAGITTGTLLMAYENFPTRFASDNINIPESNNGIPDILDELRVELNWMLKMQDTGGGVFHKINTERFGPFVMPANDTGTRFIYQVSSTATADFAAVMARASRIYQAFDSAFAQQCLAAAELAWTWLTNNPTIVPAGGFRNPPGTNTGEYGDGNDLDERLWAAAELFSSSGGSQYNNFFISNYLQRGLFNNEMGWQYVVAMAHLTYMNTTQPGASDPVKTTIRNGLINYAQNLVVSSSINGFLEVVSDGDFVWGSNAVILNRAILLIFAAETTGSAFYKNTAINQLHHLLGANAHRLSFVTGIGLRYPMMQHHRISVADGISEPIPGLISGGPDQYLSDPVLQGLFNSNTPPALCFVDDVDSYASNEIAINWSAPLVFVSGYFAAESPATAINPSAGNNLLSSIKLHQNYPNPFNPETVIDYSLSVNGLVILTIYDIIGKEVRILVNGMKQAGDHSVRWDGRDDAGKLVGSGVYWYRLRNDSASESKKMILIR